METKEKYRVVFRPSIYKTEIRSPTQTYQTWEAQLNKLHEAGYSVRTVRDDFIVMSLDSEKYEGITELEDVDPRNVNGYLAEGYVILETYSKNVRMVKRG